MYRSGVVSVGKPINKYLLFSVSLRWWPIKSYAVQYSSFLGVRMGLPRVGPAALGGAAPGLRRAPAVAHRHRGPPGHPHLHPGHGAHRLPESAARTSHHNQQRTFRSVWFSIAFTFFVYKIQPDF